jgi:hypothetical protein
MNNPLSRSYLGSATALCGVVRICRRGAQVVRTTQHEYVVVDEDTRPTVTS